MKLKKIRVSLLFFQLITVVVYGHTQNLLEINEQFDEKLYQNHTIAKHLLNKQRLLVKELEDENHPLFLENLGDYYLSIFRLDSAQHFYSKAYSSANMKEVKEMLELKQKLTAYKTCIKSETPFDHTPYSHLSESSIIEIENAFDYKFYDDSIANMIRSVDPSTLREKVFLYEYYRLKVEMIAHDKPEAGLKEIYNLIHNPIVKKDTQIIVKLLCIKSFYETITLSYKRAVATLDLAETLCNNPNLKNEIALRRGFALRRQQKFDRALEILKKVKAFYSQSSNQFDEVKTLYHIAAIYEDQGLKDSAIIHFEEAAEIEKTFPNARKAVNIYARLGSCYADVGQTFKALKNYKFCESWSIQFGALNTLSSAYSAQADLYYYQLKDYESAAEYYQKYATCLRERNQKDSDTKLAEIVGKMEYDILSNTHKSLKTEFQKTKTELIDHKRRNLIIVIVSLGIILFGVVIILVLNFKRRMAIQERELLRNRMKSTSDLIMRQEEIISNLQRITEKAPDTTKMINELIDKIRDKNDWVSFINEFQIVHPNFIENLSKISDNLTNNDNRIACLIRLQFDNREIAELSNVTYQAILKQKQRLKKKLKLEDGQDLEQFIIKL